MRSSIDHGIIIITSTEYALRCRGELFVEDLVAIFVHTASFHDAHKSHVLNMYNTFISSTDTDTCRSQFYEF